MSLQPNRERPTVLVIDDDPLIAQVVQLAQPDWVTLAATDGAGGLDIVRQRVRTQHPLDLVVLDITLPALDGRDICARLRQVAPQLPILPFTALDEPILDEYLVDWGCAAPLRKGAAPPAIAEALIAASRITPPSPAITRSAMLMLQQHAAEAERRARQSIATCRCAIFAPAIFERLALQRLLSAAGVTVSTTSESTAQLRRELAGTRVGVVVAPVEVAPVAGELAYECRIPLLLIAPNASAAEQGALSSHQSDQIPRGLLVAGDDMMQRLGDALAALLSGQSYLDPSIAPLTPEHAVPLLEEQLQRALRSTRLPEQAGLFLYWYAQTDSYETIAQALSCTPQRTYKLRHVLQHRLQLADGPALHAWARAALSRRS